MTHLPRQIENRNLFSNHFLENVLPKLPDWSGEDHRAAFEEFKRRYEAEKTFLEGLNEAQMEARFFRPLLKVLGFTAEVQEAIAKAEGFPDYALFEGRRQRDRAHKGGPEFYDRALAIAEAKRCDTPLDRFGRDKYNRRRNPSYQIWRYLRLTKPKWGILSDGKRWRLYHEDRQMESFYEADLAAILEAKDVDAFKYFYKFFCRDSLLPDRDLSPFLDRVLKGSEDYAREVSESLKENVYRAVRVLAQGFFDRPENDLDPSREEDVALVQQNSLRFLYRLLFVLYAEGRGLLGAGGYLESSYSLYGLKHEIAERHDRGEMVLPTTKVFWYSLKDLFELIDRGSHDLGIPRQEFHIPAYDGSLFDPKRNEFLGGKVIGDRHLADAIDLLARSPGDGGRLGYVDYSTLDIRHLGSIYEGLLEYRLQVAKDRMVAVGNKLLWTPYEKYGRNRRAPKRFGDFDSEDRVEIGDLYLGTHKGERKATGSYYTPHHVVEYIVRKAIGPVVERKWKQARKTEGLLRDATLSIRLVDPAMGSGHFLVGALRFLAERLLDAVEEDLARNLVNDQEAEEYTPDWAKRAVLANCIYGVDLNELAVELAKVSLWLETISKDKPLSFLDHRLKRGDSLLQSKLGDLAYYPAEFLEGAARKVGTDRGQRRFEATPFLEHLTQIIGQIASISDETRENVETKKRLFDALLESEEYERIRLLADIRGGIFFGARPSVTSDATRQYGNLTWAIIEGDRKQWEKETKAGWKNLALQLAKELNFFHWELEFPDVFQGEDQGFDALIGNPPWVESKFLNAKLKEFFSHSFRTMRGQYDLFNGFVERGKELVKPGGVFSMILPNRFCSNPDYLELRRFILQNYPRCLIRNYGDGVFPDVAMPSCVFLGRPTSSARFLEILTLNKRWFALSYNEIAGFGEDLIFPIETDPEKIFATQRCKRISSPLSAHCTNARGVEIGKSHSEVLKSYEANSVPFGLGEDVARYVFRPTRYLRLGEDGIDYKPADLYSGTKLLVRKTGHGINAAIDESGSYVIQVVYIFRKLPESKVDEYYLLALLNSRLLYEIYYTMFGERAKDTFPHIRQGQFLQLPIRKVFNVTPEKVREDLRLELIELYKDYLSSGDCRPIAENIRIRLSKIHAPDPGLVELQNIDSSDKDAVASKTEWEQSDVAHDFLSHLAAEMSDLFRQRDDLSEQFLNWMKSPLGLNVSLTALSGKTKLLEFYKAPELGSDQALDEIERVLARNKIRVDKPKLIELQEEYRETCAKLVQVLDQITKTSKLLDVCVYLQYGLSREEIAVVEDESTRRIRQKYRL